MSKFLAPLAYLGAVTAQQSTHCDIPPPGFEAFIMGYDLSTLDPLNPSDMGWKHPVLQATCQPGNTYVNDYNKKTYQLPDQLGGEPQISPSVVTDAFSFLVNVSQSFREHLAVTVKESVFWGLFSHTKSYSEVFQLLANESVYAGVQTSHVSAYMMSTHLPSSTAMNLSTDCQWLVDALPSDFNEGSFAAYDELISTCGTDFLTSAKLGCKLQYQHFTGLGKLNVMTEGDISLNAGLDFLAFLRALGAITGNGTAVSEEYLNITLNRTTCYGGGSACPQDPASYQDWLTACPNEPVFISGNFLPLDTLIRDPARAKGFQLARTNHFRRAFLEHEFIPLCELILDVVNSAVALTDSGGDCAGSPTCPAGASPCDPTDPTTSWKCRCDGKSHGCGEYGNFSCPNPVFNAELNSTVNKLQQNISAWNRDITSLVAQAKTVLNGSHVVPNGTVALLGAEFLYYMTKVQLPLVKDHCGYNLTQYEAPCTGCFPATGPLLNTIIPTRNVSYIPLL